MMEFSNFSQLDAAFYRVAARDEPVELLHFFVNSLVEKVQFALYRDFPDDVRRRGQERLKDPSPSMRPPMEGLQRGPHPERSSR